MSRTPQAGELLLEGRLAVNFRDDLGWDHSRPFLWPVDADAWIVLAPGWNHHAEKLDDCARVRVRPVSDGDEPEVGSVAFSRGWTIEELIG